MKVEVAMKRHHGGELAELDEIGMASGQPPGEEDKAQWEGPATKATEDASGQPQGEEDTAMKRDPEAEATEETENESVLKIIDQNQQMSQGGTAPQSRQVTASPCERGWISQWALPRCSGRPRPA